LIEVRREKLAVVYFRVSNLGYLGHFDNRDFDIIPDYQPRCSQALRDQTTLFGKLEGVSIVL